MEPGIVHEDKFITGGVDLYPIELAKILAEKIIFIQPPRFNLLEQIAEEGAGFATFNYSFKKRRKYVFHQNIDYIIDSRGIPSTLLFEPRVNLKVGKLQSGIPKNYFEYRQVVQKQFHFGYARAFEAIGKGILGPL